MKTRLRRLAVPLLLLLCSAARADWREIERFEDDTRIYVDRASLRRDGPLAQLRHLVRWGEPQVDPGQPPYLSTVVRTAYDCADRRQKYLASTSYAGAMGNGATVAADEDEADTWDSVSAGSMEEKLWRIACELD